MGLVAGLIVCSPIHEQVGEPKTLRTVNQDPPVTNGDSGDGAFCRTIVDLGLSPEKTNELNVHFGRFIRDLPPDLAEKSFAKFAPLIKQAANTGLGEHGYNGLANLVIADAAVADPERVFQHLLTKGSVTMRSFMYSILFSEWVKKDVISAVNAVRTLPPGRSKEELTSALSRVLQVDNPASAYALMKGEPPRSQQYGSLFSSWAKKDLNEAIHQLTGIEGIKDRNDAILGVARYYGERDPTNAWLWAQNLEEGVSKTAMSAVMESSIKSDVNSALSLISQIKDDTLRRSVISQNIPEIAQRNLGEAYALAANNLTGSSLFRSLEAIVTQDTTSHSLPIMKRAIEAVPNGRYRDQLVTKFTQRWAETDPQAVYDWLHERNDMALAPKNLETQLKKGFSREPKSGAINWGSVPSTF